MSESHVRDVSITEAPNYPVRWFARRVSYEYPWGHDEPGHPSASHSYSRFWFSIHAAYRASRARNRRLLWNHAWDASEVSTSSTPRIILSGKARVGDWTGFCHNRCHVWTPSTSFDLLACRPWPPKWRRGKSLWYPNSVAKSNYQWDRLFGGLADRTVERVDGCRRLDEPRRQDYPAPRRIPSSAETTVVLLPLSTQTSRFGIQFHLRWHATSLGKEIMSRFVIIICGCDCGHLPILLKMRSKQ